MVVHVVDALAKFPVVVALWLAVAIQYGVDDLAAVMLSQFPGVETGCGYAATC